MNGTALSRMAVRLGAELGPARVRLEAEARLLVIEPVAADEVARAVALAREGVVAVSVGRQALDEQREGAARLHVDTARLSALLHLDETSLLVHAQAGMRLDVLAGRLATVGLSLGALPFASLGRSLGAALSAPRPSEANPRGRLLDRCVALDAVLPDGTPISTRLAPRRATGPDFTYALLGARGRTGIITGVWMRADRRPAGRLFAAWAFADGEAALATARGLIDRGARPADVALIDALLDGGAATDVTLALHFDGAPEVVAAEEALAGELATAGGARPLPPPTAEAFFLLPAHFSVGGEVFVAAADLREAWRRRPSPSILRALRPAGAALQSAAPLPATTPPAAVEKLRAALARRLDPGRLFGAPPVETGDR